METQSFITREELHILVLEAGTEDYTGLYEVIWELNVKFPSVPEGEKISMARDALRDCLSGGLVELFQTRWPPVEYMPLTEDDTRVGLEPDAAWRLEQDGPGIFLAYCTTHQGQQELARLYQHYGAA